MVSSFATLIDDVLLKILEYLDYKALVSCQATCQKTNAIITASVSLRYKIELAACGMLDGPRGGQSLDITERLRRLRLYDTAWRTLRWKKEESFAQFIGRPLPSLDRNTLIFRNVGHSGSAAGYSYYTIPSAIRGVDEQAFDLVMRDPFQLHMLDASQDLLIWLDRLSSTPETSPRGTIRRNRQLPRKRRGLRRPTATVTTSDLPMTGVSYRDSDRTSQKIDEIWPQNYRDPDVTSGQPAPATVKSIAHQHNFCPSATVEKIGPTTKSTAQLPWEDRTPCQPQPRLSSIVDIREDLLLEMISLLDRTEYIARNWKTGIVELKAVAGPAQQLRLHIPLGTFSSYLMSHPLTETSTSITVPWAAWGPMGSRATFLEQDIVPSEVSAQGMRVLCMNYGSIHREQTATILDYHPLRVARALMLQSSGNNDVSILRGGPGTENTGFETTLPCIATNILLPSELPHLGWCRGYLCENGMVIIELDERTSMIKDSWFYTT
ncbi:hypothetical protein BV25DRAFT_1838982 [Artomyces pyxidatus]|uniref:Uncharacterized protein n=1 Tax=Artomyces pyxidatus TaxID=48021 RepID=A0ACB8T051_9AGAM|nr:hypothetical protein BV25DRAFT_1838982 [Artomyces pyxidatus]